MTFGWAWAVAAARDIAARAAADPPTLGDGRLVCVDGPAGSGKSTLASAVRTAWLRRFPGQRVEVVHLDDVYPGWDGLHEGVRRVCEQIVGPLTLGEPGRYRRYDWVTAREAEWIEVGPADLVVVEGCGSGASAYSAAITTLVWVEVPEDARLERGLARDGVDARAEWLAWSAAEQEVFASERTRERADVVVLGADGP